MNCSGCNIELLTLDDVCFFLLGAKTVHFIVKTERQIFAQNNLESNWESKKITNVNCIYCDFVLGKKLPIGPNNANVIAFGCEKVRLFGLVRTKLDKWGCLYKNPQYSSIEQRSLDDFFGRNYCLSTTQSYIPMQSCIKINFPDVSNLSHFAFNDILMSSVIPRQYQLACYIEALQRDLIIVLPTGSGKTLIASLVAARMNKLNPRLMTLFIVERVPLVYQQGESISLDTHLNVCLLCSENKTDYKLRQLREGQFNVLVTTAGAVLNLFDFNQLSIEVFCLVILDECHHANGHHDYVKILDRIKSCVSHNKPRIIGLTASPLSAKSDIRSTTKLLREFRQLFFNAPVCHNIPLDEYTFANQKIELITVSSGDSASQNYIQRVLNEMYIIADNINYLRGEVIIKNEQWDDPYCMIRLKKSCAILRRVSSDVLSAQVKQMKCYIAALEIADLVGVSYANEILSDTPLSSNVQYSQMQSPRLIALLNILLHYPYSSKIIIFVHTRQAGEVLIRILQENKEISNRFSPLKIFGHGGVLGMSWDNEQEIVIQKFRSGNCNLLVSTSVLEEGLDVPACDVVIRFDGIKSLISFAQSKGRARKLENSKFVLILSDRQKLIYDDIKNREIILKQALNEVDSLSSERYPSRTTLMIQNNISIPRDPGMPEYFAEVTESAIEFYISGTHNLNDLLEQLDKILNKDSFLTIKRIDVAKANAIWKRKGIFPPEDTLIICGVRSRDVIQSYRILTTKWNFYIDSIDTKPFVWTKLETHTKQQTYLFTTWPVEMLLWGSFIDKSTVALTEQYIDNEATLRIVPQHSIIISLPLTDVEIEINFITIHLFILATWQEEHVTLFIPLTSCPVARLIQYNDGGFMTTTRLTSDSYWILNLFSQHPVLSVTLPYKASNWQQLWTALHSSASFPVPLFDSNIHTINKDVLQTTKLNNITPSQHYYLKQLEDSLWLLSVLKCTRTVCLTQNTIGYIFSLITQSATVHAVKAITATLAKLLSFTSSPLTHYFIDISQYFNGEFKTILDLQFPLIEPPLNYRSIQYAVVTPSSVISHQPVTVQCSRLYRNYPQSRFLLVAFRDEQSQHIHNKEAIERVRTVLNEGIEIDGNHYYFLLSNPSQLRERRAIFLCVPNTISAVNKLNEIRKQILGKTIICDEIKFLSRIGLFSTSDTPICLIHQSSVGEISDIRTSNGILLTDGNGKMNSELSREVFAKLGYNAIHNNIPSAVQIRLAGFKGVLTVANTNDPDFSTTESYQYKILIRPSMKKMEWTDSSLNVVSVPRYEQFYINASFINLITSLSDPLDQWDPTTVLRELHTKALVRYGQILTDMELASQTLKTHLVNYMNFTIEHFDIRTEPYFLSLLRCVYNFNVNNLISKARIPLENGGLFMGIPDPIGVLAEGEVFVQYETEGRDSRVCIVEGPVLLYKHPCLHPGDLLTPMAVNIATLAHLRNVVVFPIRGRTSLPASTSGGDLDGDLFAVIWESSLIPPQYSMYPALNYEEIAERGKTQQVTTDKIPLLDDSDNIQHRLSESYCRVMANDNIGRISNLHLALCDQLQDGACNPLAISVAESQSVAVDFPKTGVAPVVAEEALELVRDKGYPDFMEKEGTPSYPSSKLLGEMYRSAKYVCYETNEYKHIPYNSNVNDLDGNFRNISTHNLYVAGCELYLRGADRLYREYSNAMQQIMTSFGLATEAEAILGLILKCHPMLSADKRKTTKSLGAVVQAVFAQFRDIFFQDVSEDDPIECSKKAFAWYYAAYNCDETIVFYSFPWIVGEYLCAISPKLKHRELELYSLLGSSVREYISNNKEYILTTVESKLSTFPTVESSIKKYVSEVLKSFDNSVFNITCFGSVSLFLCESQSDLDISINPTSIGYDYIFPLHSDRLIFIQSPLQQQRKHILMSLISPAVDGISHSKLEKYTAQVPIIAITVDSPIDPDNQVSIDITVDSDGVQKCAYIKQLYCSTGGVFYGLVWILVHWARHVGILKCQTSVENTGIILTAEFQALVLYIYNKMSNKPKTTFIPEKDLTCSFLLDLLMNTEIDSILGCMLEEFFWLGMKLTSNQDCIIYEWPIIGRPTHTINCSELKKIYFLLFQAWHCLVYTRDVASIFERNDIPLRLNKRFSHKVSKRIRPSCQFHQQRLSSMTGATVSIEDSGRNLLVSAHGSASSIHKLSVELSKLEKITSLTKKYAFNANKYILEDGYILILINQSYNIRVKLSPFRNGCFKLYHTHNERSHVNYASELVDTNWRQQAISRIEILAVIQLTKFPIENTRLLDKLYFKSRFGFFYALDSGDAFNRFGGCISLEEFERFLGKSLRYRRKITREFTVDPSTTKEKEFTEMPLARFGSPADNPLQQRETTEKTQYPSCSFCPGIKEIKDLSYLQLCLSIYTFALQHCGFIVYQQPRPYTWMMDVRVSRNFDVRIKLDENMNLLSINERPLVWMIATIIADRNAVQNPDSVYDTRLRIDTTENVDSSSLLYKRIFPTEPVFPLLSVGKNGAPEVCEEIKHKVKLVRHATKFVYYKRESVTVKILVGTEYSGKCLKNGRKFCELTLLHNEIELRQAVASGNRANDIMKIVGHAVNVSLEVSNALAKFSKELSTDSAT